VVDRQVGVLEGLLDGDAVGGVEIEHLLEQVERIAVGVGVELDKWHLLALWHVANPVLSTGGADASEALIRGRAQDIDDQAHLVDVVLAREQHFSSQELGKDASDGPDVDGYKVTNGRVTIL